MSQTVGQTFKSRIPTLGDDASIEEALRVYHYGVDNYSVQPIPNDSIEGNFRTLDNRIDTIESTLSSGFTEYLRRQSQASAPNIITGETSVTIPITVRAIASQSVPLQRWEDSSSSYVAAISTAGSLSIKGYLSVGSPTASFSSTTSLIVNVISSNHKGIIVKSSSGQNDNLQEWQNSSSQPMSWVDNHGTIFSNGSEVVTLNPLLLIG